MRLKNSSRILEFYCCLLYTSIPADNVADLADVDQVVKDSIEFFPVRKIDEVLELALTRKPTPRESLFDDAECQYLEHDTNQLMLPSI